jgi:hypothetical protein
MADLSTLAGGHPVTPDGRYFVVRGRLWRMSDPSLTEARRAELVAELMAARRAVATARRSDDSSAEDDAHEAVDRAKTALGERGPAWWTDGAPDLNRHLAKNTPYADWYLSLSPPAR